MRKLRAPSGASKAVREIRLADDVAPGSGISRAQIEDNIRGHVSLGICFEAGPRGSHHANPGGAGDVNACRRALCDGARHLVSVWAFMGSYELDMPRIYWDAIVTKIKMRSWQDLLEGRVRVQRNH